MSSSPTHLGRRAALGGAGASLALAFVPGSASAAAARLPLTAATTEGPYYFDAKKERSDITEGLAGVPLDVRFTVLGADGKPLRGLRVDIWHCDAQGNYSGYPRQGEDGKVSFEGRTFLRGSLRSDAAGMVAFRTIYPGWYRGRTTHVHFKVLNGERAVLTSQFFLPDALSELLYTQLASYRRAQLRDTLNRTDGILLQAGETVIGSVRELQDRYVASLTLVVDPASNPAVERPPIPGDPPAGGPQGPGRPGPVGGAPGGRPPMPAAPQGDARLALIVPRSRTGK